MSQKSDLDRQSGPILGFLQEAIMACSRAPDSESMWEVALQRGRWLVPAQASGVLLRTPTGWQGRHRWRDREITCVPLDFDLPLPNMDRPAARWVEAPMAGSLTEWLGGCGTLLAVPLPIGRNVIGWLVFLCGQDLEQEEKARLHQLGVVYGLNIANLYRLHESRDEARRDRQRAEQARANQADFLSRMSHEIRTPITGILGMSELLTLVSLGEEAEEKVRVILGCAETLRDLVGNILDLSKLDAQLMTVVEEPFDLAEQLLGIEAMFTMSCEQQGLSFQMHRPTGMPAQVLGDATHLKQILNNLLTNAQKFTDEGGVELKVSPAQDGFCFEVCDTGVGMTERQIAHSMDPYTQLDDSKGRTRSGVGLGLSICDRLVSLLGGTLTIESEPGVGTRAVVSLPLPVTHPREPVAPTPGPFADAGSRSVLLVDDNHAILEVLAEMLEQLKVDVTRAASGEDALEAYRRGGVQLVFLDCQMPGLSGVEVARAIREMEEESEEEGVPIIALTASVLLEDRQACLAAGMNDFVSKPVTLQSLESVLFRWFPQSASA